MAITPASAHDRGPNLGAEATARISVAPSVAAAIQRAQAKSGALEIEPRRDELAKGQEKPAAEPAVAAVVAPKAAEPDLAQQQAQKAAALMSQVASDYGQHVKRMLSASGIDTRGMSLDGQTDALQQVARQGGVGGTMMDVPEMPANGFVPMEVAAARPAQGAEMARG